MLIANTNDVGTPLHKLAEDIQTYYEIGYVPEIKSYDGSFRKIAIKMNSGDLRVQSRYGYIAMIHGLAGHGSVLSDLTVRFLNDHVLAYQHNTFKSDCMSV